VLSVVFIIFTSRFVVSGVVEKGANASHPHSEKIPRWKISFFSENRLPKMQNLGI